MIIDIEAHVLTKDNRVVGKVDRVVMDPAKNQVTHIVIHKGVLLTRDIVVPVETIERAAEHEVQLSITAAELEKMPDLVEEDYVVPPHAAPIGPYVPGTVLWPLAYVYAPDIMYEERHVPEETVDITEGTDVECLDGKIGVVDEVIVDSTTKRVTGLVVRRGFVLTRDVTVPVFLIKRADAEVVQLACTREDLEKMARSQGGR